MDSERPLNLRAGPWSLCFDRRSGWIRRIYLGDTEIVRAVYPSVRGDDWRTYSWHVPTSHQSQETDRFEATWTAEYDEPGYTFEGSIQADSERLVIELRGTASTAYKSRRTGMCVLHPLELSGSGCTVAHSDGTTSKAGFPDLILPDQPFLDVRKIEYPAGSAIARFEFAGETFEMEDQRNWTDASFKTYCRPQAWPQPFEVAEGEQIVHRLEITFAGTPTPCEPRDYELKRSGLRRRLPRLGTWGNSKPDGLAFGLNPDAENPWSESGLARVHYVDGFVNLNRNRPDISEFDAVAFSASPQVHAFDDVSILENVHTLVDVCRSAKAISGGKPVGIGPLTLKRLKSGHDDRMEDPIGAVWMLASILFATIGGAEALAIGESGDFHGRNAAVIELMAESGCEEIDVFESSHPYEVVGFELPGFAQVAINLTPFSKSLKVDHTEISLEPYAIWTSNGGPGL